LQLEQVQFVLVMIALELILVKGQEIVNESFVILLDVFAN